MHHLDDELAAHKVLKHFIAEINHLTLVAAFQNLTKQWNT